ncbi:hypothetical protein [Rhizobium multihospitium]|nr:hypothetical protein [Rhizobium multihospitium]
MDDADYPAYGASAWIWTEKDFAVDDVSLVLRHNLKATPIYLGDNLDAALTEAASFVIVSNMQVEVEASAPPSAYLAELLTPTSKASDFLANLEEAKWNEWVKRYGVKRATVVWHAQIGHFVFLHWLGVALDVLKLIPRT